VDIFFIRYLVQQENKKY